jgi:hypothetical protein
MLNAKGPRTYSRSPPNRWELRPEGWRIVSSLAVIRSVEQLPAALYLSYSSANAVIVPLDKVLEGNVGEFVRTLQEKMSVASSDRRGSLGAPS